MHDVPVQAGDDLALGRDAFACRSWQDAYERLARADTTTPLGTADLDLLATATFMLGRDEEAVGYLERAHHLHLESGATIRAVQCAVWVCLTLAMSGEHGRAGGWFARAQRLLASEPGETAQHGYLLLPVVFRHEAAGDFEAAAAAAGEAADIGERTGDRELFALALQAQGYMLIKAGRVDEGLARLDEGMVVVTVEPLSPIVTGIVYCGAILACRDAHEVRRAREWTLALTRWCEGQAGLVAFTGRCLVHRAEILQLNGEWADALEEARKAVRRFVETRHRAAGLAHYREAELLRLRGELEAAEESYAAAGRLGWEPQPGLAQLRLSQRRTVAAAAGIRRACAEHTDLLKRAGLLPAYVEIMLATGERDEARAAVTELEQLAGRLRSAMLDALVLHARGSVELAHGDAAGALVHLRKAAEIWEGLDAPYEIARTRVLVGEACRALGDEDSAALELEAARLGFERVGAKPDLERLSGPPPRDTHGLSARELEVLRLVAGGHSNRQIAATLVISEHTVARHVHNIFAKLGVSSRSAATAFAFEHDLT